MQYIQVDQRGSRVSWSKDTSLISGFGRTETRDPAGACESSNQVEVSFCIVDQIHLI